jgi:hypothetical protein
MKKNIFLYAFPAVTVLLAVLPVPAYAIQTHGAPEGLYVHQIGHILFATAMIGFAVRIRRSRLADEQAWSLMSIGAILFALWNGWAFLGHILNELIPQTDFSRGSTGLQSLLDLHAPIDVLYYLFKMDHLLCVPALVFIYIALKRMTGQAADPAAHGDDS